MSTTGYGSQPQPQPTDAPGAHDLLIADLRARIERNEGIRESLSGMGALVHTEARGWDDSLCRRIENDESLIIELEARKQLGLDKYGTLLQHDSDRDPTQDLIEELGDGMAYAKSWQEERKMLLAKIEGGALVAQAIQGVLDTFSGRRADDTDAGRELFHAIRRILEGQVGDPDGDREPLQADSRSPARFAGGAAEATAAFEREGKLQDIDRILGKVRVVTPEARLLIDEIDAVLRFGPRPMARATGRTRTELHEIVVRRSNTYRALRGALEEDPGAYPRADDYGRLVRRLRKILDGAK